MLLLHLHSTMSKSSSPMKRSSSTAIFQTTQVLPLFQRSIGGTGWDPPQCMTFSSGSSMLLQQQGPPHPECTCCHHFQHAFLLHPEWVGGQCLRWWSVS